MSWGQSTGKLSGTCSIPDSETVPHNVGCDHDSPKNLPEFSKGSSEITMSRGLVPRSLLLLMAGLLGITLQYGSFQDS